MAGNDCLSKGFWRLSGDIYPGVVALYRIGLLTATVMNLVVQNARCWNCEARIPATVGRGYYQVIDFTQSPLFPRDRTWGNGSNSPSVPGMASSLTAISHACVRLILAALELYRISLPKYEILAGEQVRVKQKDLGSTNAPAKTSNLSVDFRPTRI